MERTTIQVGTFEVNCSIIEIGGHTWLVDPGSEADRILALLEKKHCAPKGILLTHAHFDHIGGIPALQAAFPHLPVFVHSSDVQAFTHPMNQLPPNYPAISLPKRINAIEPGQHQITPLPSVQIIETPGHTPGGVCYYFPSGKLLLSGDTLFAGSIGRTDLPGGDMSTLMRSLRKLKSLPPETRIIPGHGSFTTIRDELDTNPFLQ